MDHAPKDLSGEIAISHPNCSADFQFRHYIEEQNVNFFQCVRCGLCLRVDAFLVEGAQPGPEPDEAAEIAAGQKAEQEAIETLQKIDHDADAVTEPELN